MAKRGGKTAAIIVRAGGVVAAFIYWGHFEQFRVWGKSYNKRPRCLDLLSFQFSRGVQFP